MVDSKAIEHKVIDKKEKVEDKIKDSKEKFEEKTSENKYNNKSKTEKKEKKGKNIKYSLSKDINESVDSIRVNVKNIQKIIDEKINDYKAATVQSLNAEVLETEENYYIRVAVPCVDKEKIEINVGDREISIEATFKPLSDSIEDVTVLLNEMKVGRCTKTIKFNSLIDIEKVTAKDNKGVVDLTIPKVPKPKTKVNIE